MNTCDRCESQEGVLECSQCADKADGTVYYCKECSALVHVGRTLSRHEVKPCKSQFQSQVEDTEQLLEVFQRSAESLKMKKKELENALDNVHEQQRIFERALRESVYRAQEIIMNHAKKYRNAAKRMINEREQELLSCIEECDSKIHEAGQIENDVKEDLQCASADDSNQSVQNSREKLNIEKLTIDKAKIKSLFVELPVVDYTAVIDAINRMSFKEISGVEDELKNARTMPPVKEEFETSVTLSSQLSNRGTFWAVPMSDELTSLRLNTMNLDIRKKYITDATWKTFAELQSTPQDNEKVFIRYKMDRKWYRGSVEKAHDKMCEVRFIDYGTTHTTNYDNILPYSDELFPGIPPQAVHCSLFAKELECSIQNEARWHFAKLTGDWELQAHFKHQIEVDGKTVWYVELTYVDEDSSSTINIRDEVEKKNEKVNRPRNAVISCTDVRLLDNPNFFTSSNDVKSTDNTMSSTNQVYSDPSRSPDAASVDTENIAMDREKLKEDKLDNLAESLVDSVIKASAQMLIGCNDAAVGMPIWNSEPEFHPDGHSEAG